ncbi:MAG: xanthine dehydrogenase family protein subunit M [Rhizobiales bacterium]|nr:xanthine dehydrogenase family protein subunit M [Hyphomicrobiales bacterium]
MKPAAFEYVCAETVEQATEALAGAGGDGKILAGGQSLMPMMNFRLVKPSVVVDINRIPGLDQIQLRGDRLTIGALVRHRMTASDRLIATHCPVVHDAMRHVAHLTVRNRGTFCGSVCHADPAAEMPLMTLLLNGSMKLTSKDGDRTVSAKDFFVGSLVTALAPEDLVTEIEIDALPSNAGWGFAEFSRRHGDYALAAAAVTLQKVDGVATNVRVAMMGVGEVPVRASIVESMLEGHEINGALTDRAIDAIRAELEPTTDLNASADYRRHLAGALLQRTILQAWQKAAPGGHV